ncbi:GH14294 [Drosophila grimshawi]|uniref:GH14294 n=1 Tax=Drosophila grimshawi TaxID=7222 RepID=B4JYH6_DROGR|nr:GH14294 [Drosophila grimshawi]
MPENQAPSTSKPNPNPNPKPNPKPVSKVSKPTKDAKTGTPALDVRNPLPNTHDRIWKIMKM